MPAFVAVDLYLTEIHNRNKTTKTRNPSKAADAMHTGKSPPPPMMYRVRTPFLFSPSSQLLHRHFISLVVVWIDVYYKNAVTLTRPDSEMGLPDGRLG